MCLTVLNTWLYNGVLLTMGFLESVWVHLEMGREERFFFDRYDLKRRQMFRRDLILTACVVKHTKISALTFFFFFLQHNAVIILGGFIIYLFVGLVFYFFFGK